MRPIDKSDALLHHSNRGSQDTGEKIQQLMAATIALYLGLDAFPAVVVMFPTVAMFATACTIEDDLSASSTLLQCLKPLSMQPGWV
jgi:hypothetical protein